MRKIFYANLPNYLKHWFKDDDYYKDLRKPMPESIPLNSPHIMYMTLCNKRRIFSQRRSKRLANKKKKERGERVKNVKPAEDVGKILKRHRYADWQKDETESETAEDFSSTDTTLTNTSYQIEDRIYMKELLEDPAIADWKDLT